MAGVDVQAILGNPVQPINPLQAISGWQDYANKVQQNRNMQQELANAQLANQTGQQSLGETMQKRHNQVLFGLSGLPDSQLPEAARAALEREQQTGELDPQRYEVMRKHLDEFGNDPSKIRQMINSGLVSNLAGPEALKAMTPQVQVTDIGGQKIPLVQPSQVQMLNGAAPGVALGQGGVNNTQAPGYQASGSQLIPVGGAAGSPTINQTLSPGQGTELQSRMVQKPDGSYAVETKQLQQWNPGLAPAASKGGGKSGALGGGNYPLPASTSVPMGTEGGLAKDQELYKADQAQVQPLTTGTQSLGKALDALNAVATGSGTEGLAKMRAYATSLGNVLGVDTGGVNVQDMKRAELEKYLTDYARASGTAGRSDESLNAAFKSNASGSINNAAAQDVVRTNIGRDRQKIAATMTQPNAQGSSYSDYKAKYATSTDPRGFAWDAYTDTQKQAILKEVGDSGPERRKLAKAIGDAQNLKLLNFSAPQTPNVNAAPGNKLQ